MAYLQWLLVSGSVYMQMYIQKNMDADDVSISDRDLVFEDSSLYSKALENFKRDIGFIPPRIRVTMMTSHALVAC